MDTNRDEKLGINMSKLASSEKHLDTLPLELVVNGIKYRRV